MTVSRPVGGVLSSASRRLGGHPSGRSTWGCRLAAAAGPADPRFDLAPGGVYRAARVTPGAGALLPHRFTLACGSRRREPIGGLFSVALSCGSPRLASRQHPALRSPDLPRRRPRSPGPTPRSPGRLTVPPSIAPVPGNHHAFIHDRRAGRRIDDGRSAVADNKAVVERTFDDVVNIAEFRQG